jgi:hypothetical protein
MIVKRSLMLSAALALGLLAPAAHAGGSFTGYVCQSAWVPNPAAMASWLINVGNYGIAYTYVYSAPACKGTQVGFAYFCTTGATNTNVCATNSTMTESQASSLASNLQHAGAESQKVTVYTLGPATGGAYVEFTQP